MKKFMKVCMILVLIFFGAGLTLLIAGAALGGVDNVSGIVSNVTGGKVRINTDPKDFEINVGNVSSDNVKDMVKDALQGKIYSIDNYTTEFKTGVEIKTGDVEKYRIAAGEVKKLKLNLSGCDFTIAKSDDADYWLEAKNAGKFQAYVDGNELVVITTTSSATTKKTIQFTLYVPTGSNLEDFSLELGAGRLVADELTCKECEIEIGAGECKISNGQFGSLDCSVGAGDFSLKGKIKGDVKVKCAAGNADLTLTNLGIDFNYKIDCSVGCVNLNGKKYTGLNAQEDIDHSADWDMDLDCAAGNITVKFE